MAQPSSNEKTRVEKAASTEASAAVPTPARGDEGHDPFCAAAAAYHRHVRAAVRHLANRQGELWTEFSRTLFAAQEVPPSGQVDEVIRAANHAYSKGLQEAEDNAEEAVAKSFRRYVADLRRAWAAPDSTELDPESFSRIAGEALFIAGAAQGQYPAEWWNIPEPDGTVAAEAE